MKSKVRIKRLATAALAIAALLSISGGQTFAQTAYFDFVFSPFQTLPAGYTLTNSNTLTIAQGTPAATITFDVLVTIVGARTEPRPARNFPRRSLEGFG